MREWRTRGDVAFGRRAGRLRSAGPEFVVRHYRYYANGIVHDDDSRCYYFCRREIRKRFSVRFRAHIYIYIYTRPPAEVALFLVFFSFAQP